MYQNWVEFAYVTVSTNFCVSIVLIKSSLFWMFLLFRFEWVSVWIFVRFAQNILCIVVCYNSLLYLIWFAFYFSFYDVLITYPYPRHSHTDYANSKAMQCKADKRSKAEGGKKKTVPRHNLTSYICSVSQSISRGTGSTNILRLRVRVSTHIHTLRESFNRKNWVGNDKFTKGMLLTSFYISVI